jgi:serine/threonine-protein kinase PpkA
VDVPITIPNFEVDKEIGRGGMSRVYLARQIEPKRKVAVKIVSPGSTPDPNFLQSLKQEGDLIASFAHDNIITIYACGVIDNHYYMAMEVLPGGDLTKQIEKGMRPEETLEVMLQIGSALDHAHGRGILHRDIKPENVMFHESGKAVLVDFGIAKEANKESNFTQMGAVVGTPHYMSPERCMGKPTDHRSDLYAMGVMFFEMLTGKKVYEGRDTFAVSYAHVYEPVPPLPSELSRYQHIVSKLLAKDADERYQTAKEMIEAVKRVRAGQSPEPSTRRVGTMVLGPGGTPTGATGPVAAQSTGAATPISTKGNAPVAAAPQPAAAPSKGMPMPLLIGIVGAVALIALVAALWPRGDKVAKPENPDAPLTTTDNTSKLSPEQQTQLFDLLETARRNQNLGRVEDAAAALEKVLRDLDCTNAEARTTLQRLDKDAYDKIIAACE